MRNVLTFSLLLGFGISIGLVSRRIVYNATPSFPVGLYWLTAEYSESDVVWFDVPTSVERIVSDRSYIPRDAKLMKRFVGGEGGRWCVTDRSLVINGGAFGSIRSEDSNGLPLPQLSEGCRTLNRDELLVVSNHPLSFDSRYFGPIKRSSVKGRLEELWIW